MPEGRAIQFLSVEYTDIPAFALRLHGRKHGY